MKEWVGGRLFHASNYGERRRHRCGDHIFDICSKLALKKGSLVYHLYIDFNKAFNSVPKEELRAYHSFPLGHNIMSSVMSSGCWGYWSFGAAQGMSIRSFAVATRQTILLPFTTVPCMAMASFKSAAEANSTAPRDCVVRSPSSMIAELMALYLANVLRKSDDSFFQIQMSSIITCLSRGAWQNKGNAPSIPTVYGLDERKL